MRRNLLFASILLGLQLLCSPAFAISYSGSVLLDWNQLSFSGISISPPSPGFTHLAGIHEDHGFSRLDLTDGAPGFRMGWPDWTVIGSNSSATLVTSANVTSIFAGATIFGQSGPFVLVHWLLRSAEAVS